MPTHKKPESERFKGPAKYVEYFFARALVSLLQRLPLRLAYRLGRGVGWLAWKCMSKRRAIVRKNLEIVNAWMAAERAERADGGGMMANVGEMIKEGESPSSSITHRPSAIVPHSSAIELQVREVFQRAGANIFSGFTFNRMSAEEIKHHIKIEGLEHLKTALSAGKGAIILLAHMGPWEALSQLPGLAAKHGIGAPFGAMYRPLNNAYLDQWFKKQRESSGTRLFSRRDGFHKPVDFIRSGGMLGILADQKMREGVDASFFGQPAKTSPIPGLFQRRTSAPIVAVSVISLEKHCWSIRLSQVSLPESTSSKDRSKLVEPTNQALEQMLSCSLCDGFWFQKRFDC